MSGDEARSALAELFAAVQATREEVARSAALVADGDSERLRLGAVTERLDQSVLRPLGDALAEQAGATVPDSVPTLWGLAEQATKLRSGAGGASHELLEATAALQDLAVAAPAGERFVGGCQSKSRRCRCWSCYQARGCRSARSAKRSCLRYPSDPPDECALDGALVCVLLGAS